MSRLAPITRESQVLLGHSTQALGKEDQGVIGKSALDAQATDPSVEHEARRVPGDANSVHNDGPSTPHRGEETCEEVVGPNWRLTVGPHEVTR